MARCGSTLALLFLSGCIIDPGTLSDAGSSLTDGGVPGPDAGLLPDGSQPRADASTPDSAIPGDAGISDGCVSQSEAELCADGRHCDVLTATDNCGVSRTVSCGACSGQETCGGAGTPNVCGVPGSTSPMTTAHRTSGIAPLMVFFDAVDTNTPNDRASPFIWSSRVFQPADYEGAQYSWNFGDPASGTWEISGRSKNTATGYTAAHVYETPGEYTVTLTITDGSGTAHEYVQSISVNPFSGATHYASAAGTGDGSSERTPSSLSAGMTWVNGGSNRRLLLRRGDTFTPGSTIWTMNVPGPGIIGAYGTGARPIINSTQSSETNTITLASNDWRLMDVEIRGLSPDVHTPGVGFGEWAKSANNLILRVAVSGWGIGMANGDTSSLSDPHDANGVVESESGPNNLNGAYFSGRRLVLLGSSFHDTGSSHVCRIWQIHKGVIAHNEFARNGGANHAHELKLHSPQIGDGHPESRWVTISDNRLAASVGNWTMTLAPQSSAAGEQEENIMHVIVERNFFTSGQNTASHIYSAASYAIYRNNIFDSTPNGYLGGIQYQPPGALTPTPTHIGIYNNTFYKGGSDKGGNALDIAGRCTNVTVRNNLVNVLGGSPAIFAGQGGTGFVQSNNVLTMQASGVITNPSGQDFSLPVGSPGVNTGMSLPEVREDYNRTARPIGSGYDLGAIESR